MGHAGKPGGVEANGLSRVVDYLVDAVVELEVWRQNARTAEERQALQRVTALLSLASGELRFSSGQEDPRQQRLELAVRPTVSLETAAEASLPRGR